jgi:hypothetical protein
MSWYRASTIRTLIFAVVALHALSTANGIAATVRSETSPNNRFVHVHISGPIAPGDADRVKNVRPVETQRSIRASLADRPHDSAGGSVREALRIGRLLRSQNAVVMVGANCQSSCVFVLMSGVMRFGFDSGGSASRVGVHRPHLGEAEVGQDFLRSYRQLRSELEAYFDEMRVSRALLDLMYSVRPEDMRVLANSELEELLPIDDPVYDEQQTTVLAMRYGVTNSEIRSRNAQADVCRQRFNAKQIAFEDMEPCRQAILWGLTLSEYLLRDRLSREICITRRVDRSSFKIPASLSTGECINRIMRDGL